MATNRTNDASANTWCLKNRQRIQTNYRPGAVTGGSGCSGPSLPLSPERVQHAGVKAWTQSDEVSHDFVEVFYQDESGFDAILGGACYDLFNSRKRYVVTAVKPE